MSPDLHIVSGDLDEPRDPIEALQIKLRKYPQARVESSTTRVVVYPLDAGGFEVGFEAQGGRFQVFCAGWHEEFTSSEAAVTCFSLALSPACRLKVSRRGGVEYRWELQVLEKDHWRGNSEVGLWLFPFWARLEVVYFQNRLLEAA